MVTIILPKEIKTYNIAFEYNLSITIPLYDRESKIEIRPRTYTQWLFEFLKTNFEIWFENKITIK